MSTRTLDVRAAETRLAQHRDDAAHAKVELGTSFQVLQEAQSKLLASRLDDAIQEQRKVEQEALTYSKSVNSLYQRSAKWKAEQRRLRSTLDGLDRFAEWAAATEKDLHAIAGNLEYVYAVLDKENEANANGGYARAPERESPSTQAPQ